MRGPARAGPGGGADVNAPGRVAILADVHGNLAALEAVVEDVRAVDADRVIVNGDMVNRGPDGVAVLERLDALAWPMTLGNHDDLMRMWVTRDPALPPAWFDHPYWRATQWCAERLHAAGWLPRLTALPMTLTVAAEGADTVLVSHGSPRHYREGYGELLDDATLGDIVRTVEAEVLVGSHTHRPLLRRFGRRTFLNSGAVGTPFNADPRAQYLVLHRDGRRWRPEFRRVSYDRHAAFRAFHDSGYLDEGGPSARIFLLELATAQSLLVPYQAWAARRDLPEGPDSWTAYVQAHPERFVAPDPAGAELLDRIGGPPQVEPPEGQA
ncbi:MAG: metallophosphoesterase family protein [Trueperaceae bacterium]|nr:metallophosphoesterase family protein [Trueperaceae bacterium]